jgi:hypothetical protein
MPIISSFGAGTGRGFGLTSGGPSKFIEACGGTVSTDGNYTIHTFTGPGTFCVSKLACCSADNEISYVVVAGGGGGGDSRGGGGGAGGFREGKSTVDCYTASPLTAAAGITLTCTGGIPVTIGAGGTGGGRSGRGGCQGASSIFSSITSAGGGGGGGGSPPPTFVAQSGGSGGGGGGEEQLPGEAGNTPPPVVVLLKQETIVVKVVVKLHLAVMEPLQVLILAQLLDFLDQLQEDGFLVVDKV